MPTPSQEVTSPYQAFSHNQPSQMASSFTGVVGKDAMRLVFFQTSWRGAKETLTLNHSSLGCLFDLFISLILCFCRLWVLFLSFFFWCVRHPALSKNYLGRWEMRKTVATRRLWQTHRDRQERPTWRWLALQSKTCECHKTYLNSPAVRHERTSIKFRNLFFFEAFLLTQKAAPKIWYAILLCWREQCAAVSFWWVSVAWRFGTTWDLWLFYTQNLHPRSLTVRP